MFHRKDVVFKKSSIFQPGIEEYAEAHSTAPSAELEQLHADTERLCPEWADIATSSAQVSFLSMLVGMVGAKRILEIGTFTGHATIGLAAVLPADGEIITVDNYSADVRARDLAQNAFARSANGHKIKLVEAGALETLREIEGPFDFIFVDADKPNYANYFDLILERGLLAENGLLAIDNTLWGGVVVDAMTQNSEEAERILAADADTQEVSGDEWLSNMLTEWGAYVVAFNDKVAKDPRVNTVMLTVKDGITLVRHAN
ncbi:class I SAM-dependent methyltransferase [Streptomyces sp. APSN-46.1]|uniref:O-methyltransferase n=1 Tax=Streptomyces sp. APSN-46.1 TaxID=2929049 RepID=UPI001FB3DAA4|nr:class I SAM-dependent methyltransferase [Streptomyces sp. APSN-46.1]MCJ1681153.1 class I SAM-dependent methyltransferase [Streptomyces sp. APSN-46.1]